MSLYARLARRGPTGFGYGSTAEEVTAGLSLEGKTILVTGCSSGLGLETARVLRLRGAHVVGTARTEGKAVASSATSTGGPFTGLACELADVGSIRACLKEIERRDLRFDAVIANAGIMALPTRHLAYGVELQLFTNHVGHFVLVTGLLARLTEAARVVMVSSEAHRLAPRPALDFDDLAQDRGYAPYRSYGRSKMANILFARALAKRLTGRRTANALHPGTIKTNLGRSVQSSAMHLAFDLIAPLALKSVAQGAATQCYVAVHPDAATITGAYWASCNVGSARADAEDPELAERLWRETERIVASIPDR